MVSEQSSSTEDTDLSTLVSSASLVLVGSLFGAAAKFFEQIIIGNFLSTEMYGKINVALSIMTFGATVALVGFDQGIPRFISRYEDDRDRRGIWITSLVVAGTIAIVLAVFIILARDRFLAWFFESTTPESFLMLFAVSIPFLVGLRVAIGTIQGFEITIYRTYTYDLLYNGLRLGVLIMLLLAGFGLLAAGYAYVVSAVVAFVAAHVLLTRLLTLRGEYRTHVRSLVGFSAPLVVSTGVSKLLSEIDNIMLGVLAPSGAPGVYSYGYTLAAGLPVVLSVFGFLYLPLASRLDSENNHEEVDRVYKVTTKWVYIAVFPVFLTFVAFSSDVVSVVFPKSTPASAVVLALLSVGFFASAVNGRCQDTLSAFGYTQAILVVNAVAAVLNIVLNLMLIPAYGVVGAALASALSFIALNVFAMVVLWWLSGISPFSGTTIRTFGLLPLVLFPLAFVLSNAVSLSLFALLAFAIVAGIASIVLVAVTGCLQPEDEVPVDLIEDRLGIQIPLIRRYIPQQDDQ